MHARVQLVRDALARVGMVGEEEPELLETHISWVLLARERAYKIKKAVRLPFLDYSTPELRAACSVREFGIGQRMSPELYLAPLELRGEPPRFTRDGALVEAVLMMRRFPQDAVLANRADSLTAPMVEAIADEVARVHQEAPSLAPRAARERLHRQAHSMHADFAEMRSLAASRGERDRLGHLHRWCSHELAGCAALRRARAASGHVRELHGDLHLRNIVWLDGHPRLFDPIEFNDDFRLIDTASDLGFLVMDLMARGHDDHAQTLLARYVHVTGDAEILSVIRYHLVHRALVRAKVAMIERLTRLETAPGSLDRYVDLAERLCTGPRTMRRWADAPRQARTVPAGDGGRSPHEGGAGSAR